MLASISCLALTGCGDSNNSNSNINPINENIDETADSGLATLTGFWNTAEPDDTEESYLLLESEGEGLSFVQNPNGDNCFFSEVRLFSFLGGSRFEMVSPDSNNISVELEIDKQIDKLNVTLDSGVTTSWSLVTGLLASDLQICEFTI